MKKLTILAIVLVIVSVGCSIQQNPALGTVNVSVSNDTTIAMPSIMTAPRYSCNGSKLAQPKLVGVGETEKDLHFTNSVSIDLDSLAYTRTHYPGGIINDNPAGIGYPVYHPSWWVNKWAKFLIGFLIALGIAALTYNVWPFLFPKRKEKADGSSISVAAVSEKSSGKKEECNVSETKSNIGKEDYAGIAVILGKLNERSVGGEVKLGGENGLHIKVSNSIPEINLHADRGGRIENIEITVADVRAHTIDIHEGGDNRSFNRGTGKKEETQPQ